MGQKCYAGIDVGSASARVGIFNENGERLAFAVKPIKQFHSRANFVEQSSKDIWARICEAMQEAVSLAGVSAQDIRSIGVDATCSLVAVGENETSISTAENGDTEQDIIMWMDHRADSETAAINATGDDALKYVGGEVSIEMELPKILWLKTHYPDRYAKVTRFFDLADYLVWRATGEDAASTCTLTCKWNYLAHEGRFPEDMLAQVGLEDLPQKVPAKVLELGDAAGTLTAKAAADLGLPEGIPVASGIIDAHAGGLALIGAEPDGGLAIISGTSNCHMIVNKQPVMVPGVWGPYWGAMLPGYWLGEGGQSAAGSLVDWTLQQCEAYDELKSTAVEQGLHEIALLNNWVLDLESREPNPTAGLHVLSDHHGNRSPCANPHARGVVSGLTLETGRDGMARLYLATLQAIAYGTRHIIEEMTKAGHSITKIFMCGGATKNPIWLREYANITGRDIQLAEEEDAVTLGAAILGAVACGDFADIPQASAKLVRVGGMVKTVKNTQPFHAAKYQVYLNLIDNQAHHKALMEQAIS
ncbi:FGGY-family carbohydrate kinase [Pseudovibrio sp. Tun.PSC04-5.I4]|uniref:FGGY-family carbohydrate kinase n=1 Tax=Pseudovibrio sp. Tun.PSC04-5.I4 TaxID=1798213 RepID=UPI00088BE074|nr:FGGY-family carbohydrate kinase [Pseudovibrio sp. Tun.PSC04-5.I4]SDQ86619.1 ribulokinase [Pseudovibrio sp. Tun.PSC04-5.I4]